MITIDVENSVGDLVREVPSRARVFESMKIDYCCGGKISLQEACAKNRVNADEVVKRLQQCDGQVNDLSTVDADAMSLTDLADHIEATHHAYLREELPRLDWMTEKVARVHGDKEPRLLTTRQAFVALKNELEPHMLEEESIVFPIVRQLEAPPERQGTRGGSVANPIRQMEHEHDQAGIALASLNESTDGYTPPDWACNTYRAMLDALSQLERDMHQHIHKENNVLFPKALLLESEK